MSGSDESISVPGYPFLARSPPFGPAAGTLLLLPTPLQPAVTGSFGESVSQRRQTTTVAVDSGASAAVGLERFTQDAIGRTWDFDRSIFRAFLPLEARPSARQGFYP